MAVRRIDERKAQNGFRAQLDDLLRLAHDVGVVFVFLKHAEGAKATGAFL
jgi:hypothetical protein